MSKDLYKTLGVSKTASSDDIKKAYRKLAMQHHPDRTKGDKKSEQKFREATEAYEILMDDQKRAAYDRYGSAAFEQGGFGNQQQQHPGGGFGFAGGQHGGFGASFSDIIDEMFGDLGGSAQADAFQQPGSDIRYNLEISLEEAFRGTTARVKYATGVACDPCKGTGSDGGAHPVMCPTCSGRGKTRLQQGFFTIERACHSCGGSGRMVSNPCRSCNGTGKTRREKNLEVKIPPGVEDGTRIRVSREGDAGLRGGHPGDLYVFLSISTHRFFKRQGHDIYCKVPITIITACLGGEIDVPSIDGSHVGIKVPSGTQSGHQFRVRSKGMSVIRNHARGDLIVEVTVETPVNLTKKQKEILKQFDETMQKEPNNPQSSGFFAKVKDFWEELGNG
ncbi:MAG: molecular chaperone DnaJ [Alphaproteobacteria bacterium]|nr:molecular chaperone DnaJ [Alphaproteobacteria bacterium]